VLVHALRKKTDVRTMTNRRRNIGYLREAIRSGDTANFLAATGKRHTVYAYR
jgi:hypothetical protein